MQLEFISGLVTSLVFACPSLKIKEYTPRQLFSRWMPRLRSQRAPPLCSARLHTHQGLASVPPPLLSSTAISLKHIPTSRRNYIPRARAAVREIKNTRFTRPENDFCGCSAAGKTRVHLFIHSFSRKISESTTRGGIFAGKVCVETTRHSTLSDERVAYHLQGALAQPWKIQRTQRAAIKREEECISRFHPSRFLFSWNSIICALPTIQPTRLCSVATKGAMLLEKANLAHRWHAFILRVGALLVCT